MQADYAFCTDFFAQMLPAKKFWPHCKTDPALRLGVSCWMTPVIVELGSIAYFERFLAVEKLPI
jgi:hypothetical protein